MIQGKWIFIFLLLLAGGKGFGQDFTFKIHQYPIPAGVGVNHIGVGDFNGDGKPDVITCGTYPATNLSAWFYIYMSNAADSLDTIPVKLHYQHPHYNSEIGGMCVADMNHDGLDDIVIFVNNYVYVYYQNAVHHFTIGRAFFGDSYVTEIRVVDLDLDGNKDVVIGMYEGPLSVLYGTSVTDSFTLIKYVRTHVHTQDMRIGYVGRDTDLSVLVVPTFPSDTEQFVQIKINRDRAVTSVTNFIFPTPVAPADIIPQQFAIGDIYGYGTTEILLTQFQNSLAVWLYPDTNKTSDATFPLTDIQNDQNILIADLNCDGKGEIILATGGNFNILNGFNNIPLVNDLLVNGMLYDDMIAAPVFGSLPDIVMASTYKGVVVLQNLTHCVDTTTTASATITNENSLKVYPNPFTSGFYIDGLKPNSGVELYNITGQLLLSSQVLGNFFIPRNNLAEGLYFLKVFDGKVVNCYKVNAE